VHPLGGCAMGRDATEGVVDAWGRVFNYPGLVVADGSVMPGPVGANPSLTIAALANRFSSRLIDDLRSRAIP
jgi:cholesterol oxidase